MCRVIKLHSTHHFYPCLVLFRSTVWSRRLKYSQNHLKAQHILASLKSAESKHQNLHGVNELFLPLTFLLTSLCWADLLVQLRGYVHYSILPNKISSKTTKAALAKNSVLDGSLQKQHHLFWWDTTSSKCLNTAWWDWRAKAVKSSSFDSVDVQTLTARGF